MFHLDHECWEEYTNSRVNDVDSYIITNIMFDRQLATNVSKCLDVCLAHETCVAIQEDPNSSEDTCVFLNQFPEPEIISDESKSVYMYICENRNVIFVCDFFCFVCVCVNKMFLMAHTSADMF